MKITNINEAVRLFEEIATNRADALKNGKYKIANRNYDKLIEISRFLKEHKSLHELSIYYAHPNMGVRKTAAAYLLPVDEKRSINVLKEIANLKVFESLDAEMTIKEWKKGKLKDFYTL